MADVSIVCGSTKHRTAQSIAIAAILLYPIGLFALNGALLFYARDAILSEKPTALSRAVAFLHREYLPAFYFWELMEMARRFLLVGLFTLNLTRGQFGSGFGGKSGFLARRISARREPVQALVGDGACS